MQASDEGDGDNEGGTDHHKKESGGAEGDEEEEGEEEEEEEEEGDSDDQDDGGGEFQDACSFSPAVGPLIAAPTLGDASLEGSVSSINLLP